MTVAAALRNGLTALFCPACGDVKRCSWGKNGWTKEQLEAEADADRCARCQKAWLEVVEPKA